MSSLDILRYTVSSDSGHVQTIYANLIGFNIYFYIYYLNPSPRVKRPSNDFQSIPERMINWPVHLFLTSTLIKIQKMYMLLEQSYPIVS